MSMPAATSTDHATPALAEADRLMTICNSCRYCEGLCAVFPAMEMRRAFPDGDLNYLANLCHGCGACYIDCQFSPPHAFNVNVPQTLAIVRAQSYQAYAWPRALAPLFARNGLAISIIAALNVAIFIAGFVAWHDAKASVRHPHRPGRVLPADAAQRDGCDFRGGIRLCCPGAGDGRPAVSRAIPANPSQRCVNRNPCGRQCAMRLPCAISMAAVSVATVPMKRPTDNRRLYHHFTFYGFLLCFASTSVATLYHYLLGMQAPYPWYDLPVVLGTLGGIGLVIGPIGLFKAKQARDPALQVKAQRGMDVAFLAMLFLTGLTGLLLLVLRATPAMGLLLALHLGVVLGLFVTMPYGKFVHGIYRFIALVRYARERHTMTAG